MKYETAPAFDGDFRRLTKAERKQFLRVALEVFAPACDAFVQSAIPWPARLRIKPLQGAPGILELTWSFSGPDGRSTWEWHTLPNGDPCVRWRRIGDHKILSSP